MEKPENTRANSFSPTLITTERMRAFHRRREECISGGDVADRAVATPYKVYAAQLNVPMVHDGDETIVPADIS